MSPSVIQLPEELGTIRETYAGDGGRLIVHIENPEPLEAGGKVRLNEILTHLDKSYGIRVVEDLNEPAVEPYTASRETLAYLTELRGYLSAAKGQVYHGDLKALDQSTGSFRDRELALEGYLNILFVAAKKALLSLKGYPDLSAWWEILDLKGKMDPGQVEGERAFLVERLNPMLEGQDKKHFSLMEASFSSGAAEEISYYRALEQLATKKHFIWKNAPQLSRMIRRVNLSSRLNRERSLREAMDLEKRIRVRFYKNKAERDLDELLGRTDLLMRLFSLEGTEEDFEYVLRQPGEFDAERWGQELAGISARGGVAAVLKERPTSLDEDISEVRAYYRSVSAQDKGFVDAALAKMESAREPAAVLIAERGLSQHMTNLFKKMGISYVVIQQSDALKTICELK